MSSLNLLPNVSVMAVQAGIFVSAVVTVKKLFLEPYQQVTEKRELLTVGNKKGAEELTKNCQEISSEIQKKISLVTDEIKSMREKSLHQAISKRDQILEAAEKTAKDTVQSSKESILSALADEKSKIPAITEALSGQLFEKTIH